MRSRHWLSWLTIVHSKCRNGRFRSRFRSRFPGKKKEVLAILEKKLLINNRLIEFFVAGACSVSVGEAVFLKVLRHFNFGASFGILLDKLRIIEDYWRPVQSSPVQSSPVQSSPVQSRHWCATVFGLVSMWFRPPYWNEKWWWRSKVKQLGYAKHIISPFLILNWWNVGNKQSNSDGDLSLTLTLTLTAATRILNLTLISISISISIW